LQLDLDGDGAVLAVIDDRLDAPIKLKDVNLNGKSFSSILWSPTVTTTNSKWNLPRATQRDFSGSASQTA
jgi:hypothetical protein